VFAELPCEEPDPLNRLYRVHAAMSARKRDGEPEGADLALKAAQQALERAEVEAGEIDLIVVGTTTSRRPVLVNGIPKTKPFLIADCIHVWQTGGTEIAEFKEDVGGGLSPLPEKTYCVAKK